MTVRVFLVDDHPVVRAGLAALLEGERVHIVGQASTGEEALAAIPAARPDVVLMDLRLGDGLDGLGTTRRLLAVPPGAPPPPAVLILTTYDGDADIVAAVQAGAAGYLLKDALPEDLLRAVETAARGERGWGPGLEDRLVDALRRPHVALSPRELDVLAAVAAGASNREVARRLVVSEATVKTHLVHIFGKLGVDNRTAAVAQARARGLLD